MKRKKRGYALILMMGICSVWMLTVMAMAQSAQASLQTAYRTHQSLQALYAAESGVAAAMVALKTNENYAGDQAILGEQGYLTKVYASPGPAPNGAAIPDDCVYVFSKGTSGSSTREVGALVHLGATRYPLQGAYVMENMKQLVAAGVDSYSSAVGPYNLFTNRRTNGDIVTNSVKPGSVQLALLSQIQGTVKLGPKGQVGPTDALTATTNMNDVVWKGLTTFIKAEMAQTTRLRMPRVIVPDLGASKGDVIRVLAGTTTIDPGNYGKLTTAVLSSVRLNPGTYVFDSIDVLAGGIVANGPVKIYVRNSASIAVGGVANQTLIPANMIINLADGVTANVAGGSQAAMVVYGPKAQVNVVALSDIYGSIVGQNVNVVAACGVHFDEDLKNLEFDPSGGQNGPYTMVWQRF